MNQETILKYNIWKQVVSILLASIVVPGLFWVFSIYIDIGDWQGYFWLIFALGVVAAIGAVWHSERTSHRFGLRPEGISINFEFFSWQAIQETRLTQRGHELPIITLYLDNEKRAYLVQLSKAQYATLLEALKVGLGDRLKVSPRAHKANYPHINTNIYHNPNQ
ncbi:hypothetical protein [Microscilla marina]|uniref:Uncharacterized protein n=1 Tax=Microscilla marina ATCC 23134 TaxID=313606 RepID=A1ZVC8_MICM2|nr:hypothetical protein [Microscilla marina]EAY25626.1 hypothetical protein M23134_07277 [Microscilla marina ATCC 23134]